MKLLKYPIIGIKTIIINFFLSFKYVFIGLITILTIIPHYVIAGIKFLFKKNYDKEEKKIEKKILPITIMSLSITTYLISIFLLTRWYVQNERSEKFTNDITNMEIKNYEETFNDVNQYEETTTDKNTQPNNNTTSTNTTTTTTFNSDYLNVNLNYYFKKNNETVAWLQVNGTKVNYPVVQHSDNNYYLEHDFYKRKTMNGWIFADYRNDFNNFDNNTIIYGHNIINKSMFGSLPNLLKKNWFSTPNRNYIKLSTKTTNSIWEIFSVYKIEPTTDYLQAKFNSITVYEEFLKMLKNRSAYQFDTSISNTDKIITLSTCDDTGTKRVVIHGKLIKIENK